MTRRRRPGPARRCPARDRGSFTAEMAAGLPALIVLLVAGLSLVSAASAKLTCLDAAREGAVAAARGEDAAAAASRVAPDGARVAVSVRPDTVVVEVEARVTVLGTALPRITVRATATAAAEPGATS